MKNLGEDSDGDCGSPRARPAARRAHAAGAVDPSALVTAQFEDVADALEHTSSSTVGGNPGGSRSPWRASRAPRMSSNGGRSARGAGTHRPAPDREAGCRSDSSRSRNRMPCWGRRRSAGSRWTRQKDVGMALMAFVFPLELVATTVAFLARDTLGAETGRRPVHDLVADAGLALPRVAGRLHERHRRHLPLRLRYRGLAAGADLDTWQAVLLGAAPAQRRAGWCSPATTRSSARWCNSTAASGSHSAPSRCTDFPRSPSRTPGTASCCRSSAAGAPTGRSRATRRSSSGWKGSQGVGGQQL